MEALSLAVRRRIIELFQSGLEGQDVAEIMACSPAAARRVWQRYRDEGRIEPRPHAGGHTPKLSDEQKNQVLGELVAQKPDAFCRELADELHARTGVRVCRQTIGSWLMELGFTRKKSRCMPGQAKPTRCEQERPDVRARREVWLDTVAGACGGDFSRVSFLDESGALTNLLRTYGRSDRGTRCTGSTPQGHWKVMTAVAAVRLADGLVAPFTIDAAMDGEIFITYIRQVLAPTLRTGDVVVMDNLSAHKRPEIKRLIEAAGATLLYLPPYSPDFNPIEMIWSKVKRLLRSFAARTIDALHDAFGHAFAAVTRSDIAGCFRHCGYATGESAPL